jgi:poly-gamma-glutamate capsule biosynthesis protein CapA/YwtB (metallophosphatase superfamily)
VGIVRDGLVTLFLCGDVMLGRGVDQILPHPGDPELRERNVRDARTYVRLAEQVNGPIPRPVDFDWPWGVALPVLDELQPDVRIINLETSITRSSEFASGKGVHYRMSPDNIGCLTVAHPHVCALANNHVLDFGVSGLKETLDTLAAAALPVAGAGIDAMEAQRAAVAEITTGRRIVVFSLGLPTSGIPPRWAAREKRPGVDFLPDLSEDGAAAIGERVRKTKQRGDIVVASVHWGPNWGYEVSTDEIRFARLLIDSGVDLFHGHSSHHPRPIEVYHGKLILYGCGDFIDDYEGIGGYEHYRDDLRLLFHASLHADTGDVSDLTMWPVQARKMRLEHASRDDAEWLCAVLGEVSREFGTSVNIDREGRLVLRIDSAG